MVDRQYSMVDGQYSMVDRQYSMVDRQYSMVDRQYSMVDRQYSMVEKHYVGITAVVGWWSCQAGAACQGEPHHDLLTQSLSRQDSTCLRHCLLRRSAARHSLTHAFPSSVVMQAAPAGLQSGLKCSQQQHQQSMHNASKALHRCVCTSNHCCALLYCAVLCCAILQVYNFGFWAKRPCSEQSNYISP
jgi:hypothetical protein